MSEKRQMLRHFLAALAHRTQDGSNVGAAPPAPVSPDEAWHAAEDEPRGTE